jgi:hypothetical protein
MVVETSHAIEFYEFYHISAIPDNLARQTWSASRGNSIERRAALE